LTVAVLLWGSEMVSVHVPAAAEVTVTLVPETAAVTMPVHPDAVYGPATPSTIVTICGFAVVASNVRAEFDSTSGAGVGVGVGVGLAEGDAVGVGLAEGSGEGEAVGDGLGAGRRMKLL
jgi:hypothetical protein